MRSGSNGERPARCRRSLVPAWLWLCFGCTPTEAPPRSTLQVFVAASLTDVFRELERQFETEHPGLDVIVNSAGSHVLRLQIEHGAPADVFASADEQHVQSLAAAGLLVGQRRFAHNALVVIVPRDNPAGVETFDDLQRAEKVVLGAPSVPIGAYSEQLLDRAAVKLGPAFSAKVRAQVVSRESNVRLVRAKIESGEADAAIVYQSDMSPAISAVEIPPDVNVRANCSIGVVSRTRRSEAQSFITYVSSLEGRQALERHGLEAAP